MRAARGWLGWCLFCVLLAGAPLPSGAQQPAPPIPEAPAKSLEQAQQEFLLMTEEVLQEVSELLALPVLGPLKKSLRSREEIRTYLLREFEQEKNEAKRYADRKVLEKFGLIPKDFSLDEFLIELLTEQVAGLYDPREKEFYVADWVPLREQRMVMAHELVHALHDQHFNVKPWLEAVKPDDDAHLARGSVLEGAALAAMIDHALREQQISIRQLPDVRPVIQSLMLSDFSSSPQLARAPQYIRDALLFPYLEGTAFTQAVLRARDGWTGFNEVFANPPVSTQQILHPELYLEGVLPARVTLPEKEQFLGPEWKKLDENVAGEFGTHAVLKRWLGPERADSLASAWRGDRYGVYENTKTKEVALVFRLQLANEAAAARFFGQYSEALELKYETRRDLFRRPNFFTFESDEGGVFLRCHMAMCVVAEGIFRRAYDQLERDFGWPAAPPRPAKEKARPGIAAAPHSARFPASAISSPLSRVSLQSSAFGAQP